MLINKLKTACGIGSKSNQKLKEALRRIPKGPSVTKD
jgi:hypothetical protein